MVNNDAFQFRLLSVVCRLSVHFPGFACFYHIYILCNSVILAREFFKKLFVHPGPFQTAIVLHYFTIIPDCQKSVYTSQLYAVSHFPLFKNVLMTTFIINFTFLQNHFCKVVYMQRCRSVPMSDLKLFVFSVAAVEKEFLLSQVQRFALPTARLLCQLFFNFKNRVAFITALLVF